MNNIDDNTMQHRLYDILKMNIKLAKQRNELNDVPAETFESFEQVCRKIDSFNHETYESELEILCSVTTNLTEEKYKLEKLVKLISDRIEERNNLVNEYQDLTMRILDGLSPITDSENLEMYKKRLSTIREYLENQNNIAAIEHELSELNRELDVAYEQKKLDEEENYKLEDNLLTCFRNVLRSNEVYSDINTVIDVDFELEKVTPKVLETKKTLETFEKAFENLKRAGISSETEIEYSNYVADAKKTYYQNKEREFLLRIYKILINKQNECNDLFSKRESLDSVLDEREQLRISLGIVENDVLGELHDLIAEQSVQISKEKQNVEKIRRVNEKIEFKNKKLDGYIESNSETDILVILQEFGIISTYNDDNLETLSDAEDKDSDEDIDKLSFRDLGIEVETKKTNPNAIKSVTEVPEGINISFVINKATTVMRRVGKALGFEVAKPKVEYVVPVSIPNIEEIVPTPSVEPENKEEPKEESLVDDSLFSMPLEPFEGAIPEIKYNVNDKNIEKSKKGSLFTVEPVVEILPEVNEKPKVEPLPDTSIFSMPPKPFEGVMPEIKYDNNNQNINKDKKIPYIPEEDIEFKSDLQPGLFWPEPSNPKLSDDKFVTMEQPFPDMKKDDEFNPQVLNSRDEFAMPEIPMGNMTLSSPDGTLGSPIRIKRGR